MSARRGVLVGFVVGCALTAAVAERTLSSPRFARYYLDALLRHSAPRWVLVPGDEHAGAA